MHCKIVDYVCVCDAGEYLPAHGRGVSGVSGLRGLASPP